MKQLLFALLLLPCAVFAQTTDPLAGLSESQKAEVLASIAKTKAENADPAKKVDVYMATTERIAEAVGRGLATTAKEIGVAVNDFVKTDVGKITAFLLIWNYGGHDMVKMLAVFPLGVMLMLCSIMLVRMFYKNKTLSRSIEYGPKTNWLGRREILSIKEQSRTMDGEEWVGLVLVGIITLAPSLVVIALAL